MNVRNNNTKGIFFILGGMALFSVQDSLIKFIYKDLQVIKSSKNTLSHMVPTIEGKI